MRRFYLRTAASAVVPGAGLLGTRRKDVGAVLVGLTAVLTVAVVGRMATSSITNDLLATALSRKRLLVIGIGVVVALLVWLAAIIATSRVTAPPDLGRIDRTTVRLFTTLCCVVVALPSAFAVRIIGIQSDVVHSIFRAPDVARTVANPDANKADPWQSVPRVNLLLLGSDAGWDRVGTRTDSMMVASIDTKTGDTVLFGIPRNLEKVPFSPSNPLHAVWPNGFGPCPDATGVEQCLLNAVWTEATVNHPDLFVGIPNPGLYATKDAISQVLGLRLDYTVVVDLAGFQQLVDAMGGVDVTVHQRLCMGCKSVGGVVVFPDGRPQYLEPGRQHLNGYQALWFARSRAETDDYDRMRRQRCLVGALVRQVNPVKMVANYGAIAAALKSNVSVDIPENDLPAWVTLVGRIQKGTIRSLAMTNGVISVTHPDFAKIHALVLAALTPPTPSAGRPQATVTPAPTTATSTPTRTATSAPTTPAPQATPPTTAESIDAAC